MHDTRTEKNLRHAPIIFSEKEMQAERTRLRALLISVKSMSGTFSSSGAASKKDREKTAGGSCEGNKGKHLENSEETTASHISIASTETEGAQLLQGEGPAASFYPSMPSKQADRKDGKIYFTQKTNVLSDGIQVGSALCACVISKYQSCVRVTCIFYIARCSMQQGRSFLPQTFLCHGPAQC